MSVEILVIIGWLTSGPIVTTVEFDTMQACHGAREELLRQTTEWGVSENKIRAFCLHKR
jgi:hypothetical protein